MFNTPDIVIAKVNKFISDEIHITGKSTKTPKAALSFVPVDDNGDRITSAPVAIVTLEGESFNYWYQNWNGETELYSTILECLKTGKKGFSLTGVDLSKLGSIANLKVTPSDEVLSEDLL